MDETVEQLQSHINAIWKKRWVVIGVAYLVCIVGWTVVYLMPDKYASMARVFLDSQSMLDPVLKGLAVDGSSETVAESTRRTLLSRPNLEKVIRNTDMDLSVKDSEERERLLKRLGQEIKVSGNEDEDRIYTIMYENVNPEMAKRVVEALLSIFMEDTLGSTRVDTTRTQQFIENQIQEYEKKLIDAEDRLKTFQRENIGMLPNQSGDYFKRLQAVNESLQDAQSELDQAQKRRDELKRQIYELSEQIKKQPLQSERQSSLEARIAKLESSLDELLINYTSDHPDVVELNKQLDMLKKKQKAEADNIAKDAGLSSSPVYQELMLELSKADANISALQVRKNDIKGRVISLEKLINTMPEVEAQLVRLNRDYDVLKKNYEELVQRRESTKISSEAARNSNDVEFKLIDPPVAPLLPISPNRPLLISIVLLGGIGAGIGLAWLIVQVRPTFNSASDLRKFGEYPVYGVITLASPEIDISKKSFDWRLAASIFGLLMIYTFVLLSHGFGLI